MKRVLVVSLTDINNDPRVSRHVQALSSDFAVLTAGFGTAPPGVKDHVSIPNGLKPSSTTVPALLAESLRLHKLAYSLTPAVRYLRPRLGELSFDVALANDAMALPITFQAAAGRPVIADMHEHELSHGDDDWRWRWLVRPVIRDICRQHLPDAAAVTTVADGIAKEYDREFGTSAVTVWNADPARNPQPRPVSDPIRLVHSGMAQRDRRLEHMITAADRIQGITLELMVVPDPYDLGYYSHLEKLAESSTNVRLREPVAMERVPEALDAYDVGLSGIEPTNFSYLHSLPNKFFNYVQSGLGVVVGPSPEMASLTRRYSMGAVARDFGPAALRLELQSLDRSKVATWQQGARRAATELTGERAGETLRAVVSGCV